MTQYPDPAPAADPLDREPLRFLVGPTASGKTRFALEIAEAAGAEIVSMDSMLVYRGLDVGTAKPSAEERARVRHHLIDLVEPEERYDVQSYLRDARTVLEDVASRGARALFVGGTGFYLAAVLRGLFEGPPVDPELRARLEARVAAEGAEALHAELAAVDPASAERIHANDTKRLVRALEVQQQTGRPLSVWQEQWGAPSTRQERARIVGLRLPRPVLDERIGERCAAMFEGGWREEAVALEERLGPGSAQALGYREVLEWARGECSREEAIERITRATRRFARRQDTWYRKFSIEWLPAEEARLADALAVYGW